MRIGIIARSDNTGLGNQTRELVKMFNPQKIMLINSTVFNKNKQHPEWYKDYDVTTIKGFPSNHDVSLFLRDVDVVISCETFYNNRFVEIARKRNVKTILQYNYEFLDYLNKTNMELPDILLAPSVWNIAKVSELFGDRTQIIYLPPPTDSILFENNRDINLSKDHNKILHIAGKIAAEDRNGTNTVLEMLKYSNAEYQLVIKTQSDFNLKISDDRVFLDKQDHESHIDLYGGFDAMVLPRRYAGLCLPMNEALLSALPVFMTDVSPNNFILPKEWLSKSNKIGQLQTRTILDVYSADPKHLAKIIDSYINNKNKKDIKNNALDIGMINFSKESLKNKYLEIIKK